MPNCADLEHPWGTLHDDSKLDGPPKNIHHPLLKHAMAGLVPATRCPADANPRICIAKLIPRSTRSPRIQDSITD